MRRWHVTGAALLLAAGSITALGSSSASADPQGKPFDGSNLRNGSVTYDKLDLADGDIPAAKVSGVVSRSALDQLAADLTAGFAAVNGRHDRLGEEVALLRQQGEEFRESLRDPSAGTPLVAWSKLVGVPSGFADTIDDVDGGTAADVVCASLCISDDELAEVSAYKIRGQLTAGQLAGDIGGALITDGSLTSADLAGEYVDGHEAQLGAVTSDKIADGAVELRDLSQEVRQRLPRFALSTVDTPGGGVTVAPGERVVIALPAAGVVPGDFLSVSPPAALAEPLVFAGAMTASPGIVSAWVYNPTSSPRTVNGVWQVAWISFAA